jgi:hypothetical protein
MAQINSYKSDIKAILATDRVIEVRRKFENNFSTAQVPNKEMERKLIIKYKFSRFSNNYVLY